MQTKFVQTMPTSKRFRVGSNALLSRSRVIAGLAVAVAAFATPSQSFAQVSLGSTSNGAYAIFENGTGSGSLVSVSGTNVISGNVEFGTGISPLSTTPSGGELGSLNNAITNPGTVLQNVAAVSTTLPTATSTTNLTNISSNTTLTAASGASVNVYNISGSINLQGETLTLSGNSNQYFIFNVSGGITVQGGDFDFVPSTIGTSGTLDASHVIFIVGGTGNDISISGALFNQGSSASGTFVDTGGTISVSGNSSVTGALISNNSITVSGGSTVTADNFAAPASAHAPEMPTIMTAGLACVLMLGTAGIRKLRG
jgi:hypothetical protein